MDRDDRSKLQQLKRFYDAIIDIVGATEPISRQELKQRIDNGLPSDLDNTVLSKWRDFFEEGLRDLESWGCIAADENLRLTKKGRVLRWLGGYVYHYEYRWLIPLVVLNCLAAIVTGLFWSRYIVGLDVVLVAIFVFWRMRDRVIGTHVRLFAIVLNITWVVQLLLPHT